MLSGIFFFIREGWIASKRYILYLFFGELIKAIQPLINIVIPKLIIDGLVNRLPLEEMLPMIVLLVGLNFGCNLLSGYLSHESFFQRILVSHKFVQKFSYQLYLADYEKIETPGYLDLKQKAEKFIYGDMRGFGYILDSSVAILSRIVTFVAILAIIFTLHWLVVLIFVVLVLISVWVESRAEQKCVSLHMDLSETERRGYYLGGLFSSFEYAKEIRLGVLGDWLMNKLKEHNAKTESIYRRVTCYRIGSSVVASITLLVQQLMSYCYIIYQVIAGSITIGSFAMYVGAVSTFFTTMRDVLFRIVQIRVFRPYFEAAKDYFQMTQKLRQGAKAVERSGKHTIELRGVSFRYSGQTQNVLNDINLVWHAGERLSLVGENGAGKSTLVKLLTRLYDPTEGQILLDGVDIREYDYDEYMKVFATVFQDFRLFAFSLRDNICLTRSETSDQEILNALRESGLELKISQLNHGLDTSVFKQFDESGFEPSGESHSKLRFVVH
ncbi:MAG: ABC transporter ATP-binding protein [Bacillota bacterium]|nr:ABC transporter ATP-binding protein [Bacillota bacterium]